MVKEGLVLAVKLHHAVYMVWRVWYFVCQLLYLSRVHLDGEGLSGRSGVWGSMRKKAEAEWVVGLT